MPEPAAPTCLPCDLGPPAPLALALGLPVGCALFDAAGPLDPGGIATADAPGPDAVARFAALALDPVETLWFELAERTDDPFEALAELAARAHDPRFGALPGPAPLVACALAYDLGRRVEAVPEIAAPGTHRPDLWAARYAAVYVYDRHTAEGRVLGTSRSAAERLHATLTAAAAGPQPDPERPIGALGPARCEVNEANYVAALKEISDNLQRGEVYQVNHTVRFAARRLGALDLGALFAALHAASPVPYAAALRLDAHRAVLSLSPERFLRWTADGHVETRPIKGTRPRHADPTADAAAAAELQASAKDAAEHVMIVDLERNDLGRVCVPGSVKVRRFRQVERYATVHHLVSVVAGQLLPEVSPAPAGLPTLLRALFPGGSITGAPKLRAMQLIERLEPVRRGIYCGAVGYLDAAGGGDLNLPIRTVWTTAEAVYYQAGGGIVADSTAAEEWAEVRTKARAFVEVVARAGDTVTDR